MRSLSDAAASSIDKAAQAVTYTGTASAFTFWGLSISELGVIISAIAAMGGFVVHLWSSIRRDRRERAAHELLLAERKKGVLTYGDPGNNRRDSEGYS